MSAISEETPYSGYSDSTWHECEQPVLSPDTDYRRHNSQQGLPIVPISKVGLAEVEPFANVSVAIKIKNASSDDILKLSLDSARL